jgi:hypothetical protein
MYCLCEIDRRWSGRSTTFSAESVDEWVSLPTIAIGAALGAHRERRYHARKQRCRSAPRRRVAWESRSPGIVVLRRPEADVPTHQGQLQVAGQNGQRDSPTSRDCVRVERLRVADRIDSHAEAQRTWRSIEWPAFDRHAVLSQ